VKMITQGSCIHSLMLSINVSESPTSSTEGFVRFLSSCRQRGVYTELGDRKRDCNEICGSSDTICTLIFPITIISGIRHALIYANPNHGCHPAFGCGAPQARLRERSVQIPPFLFFSFFFPLPFPFVLHQVRRANSISKFESTSKY
jgi:hypothetical protein